METPRGLISMSHARDPESPGYIPHGHRARPICHPLLGLMAMAILGALAATPYLQAQGSRPTEYDVKAAYLYNFGRFVAWPGGVEGRRLHDLRPRPGPLRLRARRHACRPDHKEQKARRRETNRHPSGPGGLPDFVYQLRGGWPARPEIIEALDKKAHPHLSDMPQFSDRGGMIQFIIQRKRNRS